MSQVSSTHDPNSRKNERGAALLTSLMVATLLLAAGGALIQITSMSASNAIDSTAEAQAYYGAEAGLQAALNALRGNAAHTASALPSGMSTINFLNAVVPGSSNDCPNGAGGDPSTVARGGRANPRFGGARATIPVSSPGHENRLARRGPEVRCQRSSDRGREHAPGSQ